MSDEKISAMPNAAALTGAELVPVVQGGANVKTTSQAIGNTAPAGSAFAPARSIVYCIGSITTKQSHTGDTNETKVASIPIPANLIGANGILRITALWSRNQPGATSNVTVNIYLSATNDLTGTLYSTQVLATASNANTLFLIKIITNRNSPASQFSNAANALIGSSSGAPVTSSVDTTAQVFVVFSVTLVNAGDTGSIESAMIELIPAGGN